jgi:peptidoglycan hydrolase CwlO-like protein
VENEIGKQIDVLVAEMQGKVIETDEQFQFVGEWLKRNKQTQKIVEDHFAPKKEELYRPYKDLLAEIKGYMDRLQNAERAAKQALSVYQQKKERERQAEIQRQQEAARKRSEEATLTAASSTGNDFSSTSTFRSRR